MSKEVIYQIIKNKISAILWSIVFFLILLLWYFTIDISLLEINFGIGYAIIHIILHILISIWVAWLFMIENYSFQKKKEISDKKPGILWLFWSIIWIIITGCPVCWWTLVSALWLSGLLSFLPWYGLELKLLSVFVLFWAQDILIGNIDRCQLFIFWKWIIKKKILYSFVVLFLSIIIIAYTTKPTTSMTIPWWIILIPSLDYNVYSYNLKEWCSNNSYFIESYTQTNKETKILWLSIYDKETIENFAVCNKEWWLEEKLNIDQFWEIIWEYKRLEEENKLKKINNTNYLVKHDKCQDFNSPYCLWGEYWIWIKNKLYMVYVTTISEKNISIESGTILLDNEISKWTFIM